MKQLLAFVFLLFTVSAFGANPSYKDFRGINGIIVSSNPPQGTIVFDGSGIMGPTGGVSAATVTNIVNANSSLVAPPLSSVQFNSNGVMQGSSDFLFTNGNVVTTGNFDMATNKALMVGGSALLKQNYSSENIWLGISAGQSTTTGKPNIGIGRAALFFATTNAFNTGVGDTVFASLIEGSFNTHFGNHGFGSLTNGTFNTGIGLGVMEVLKMGNENTAGGMYAGANLILGSSNSLWGSHILHEATNVTGASAVGNYALRYKLKGDYPVAVGVRAGHNDTNGIMNGFIGAFSAISDSVTAPLSNAWAVGANGRVATNNAITFGGVAGSTNGLKVGIGTDTPLFPLHVVGTAGSFSTFERNSTAGNAGFQNLWNTSATDGSGAMISFGTTTTGAGATANKTMARVGAVFDLHDDATSSGSLVLETRLHGTAIQAVKIATNGFVGIGTLLPSSSLDVTGQVRAASAIITNMAGSGDIVAVNSFGQLLRTNITGGGSVAPPISSVQFNSNGVMQGSAAFTFTNGLVGIGTAVPLVALHINNDGAVSSPHLRFEKAAADVRWEFAISSNPETYNLGLGRVGDATYAMVWELGGNVGIGTTNPATRFDVQGRTTLRSNVFFPNISSNASPVAFLATDAAGEVFETAGVPGAAGANFEVQFNNAGVMGASPNLRFVGGGYQLQIINPTVPGEVDINGEGFISQGVGGASLAFGIGALTNLMIQGDGAVIVRPSVNINTNIFQIEATNKVPIVLVDTNGNFFVQRGLSVGPLGSATLTNTLYASATLDFPSTVAGTVSDLPITVAGAADGDIIALGEPSGSIGPLTGVYNAWASNGVVYVRFANNNLVTAQDPASGTFKVRVDKFK